MKRVLISVSDKTGILKFAKNLIELEYEIISTGGTAKKLQEASIKITPISDITGYPECLDGRVKTLHPAVHGGLLAKRNNRDHMNALSDLNIKPIDMVVVNLYPFKETLMSGASYETIIENIDIGGPTMIRSAAKNYQDVTVIVDVNDYDWIIEKLKEKGDICTKCKLKLAKKVFHHTSAYDTLISQYFDKTIGEEILPENITLTYEKVEDLRYGENPHQEAAFYKEIIKKDTVLANAKQLHGKALSFNNINDANGAIELLREFEAPTVVASKHTNPCGVATAIDIETAYKRAYEGDPVSIFGGIIAVNREVNVKTAVEMVKTFLEIIIAPSFSKEALEILTKKKNLRLLKLNILPNYSKKERELKFINGGLLVQTKDKESTNLTTMKCVTKIKTDTYLDDLIFANKIVKHTKSNGIVLVKNKQTVGIGPGQTSRVMALEVALKYAGNKSKGSIMGSDAFFPFSDCVEIAAKAGIKSIIQPGGSIRDNEIIEMCDKHGISMLFTGIRHFKH